MGKSRSELLSETDHLLSAIDREISRSTMAEKVDWLIESSAQGLSSQGLSSFCFIPDCECVSESVEKIDLFAPCFSSTPANQEVMCGVDDIVPHIKYNYYDNIDSCEADPRFDGEVQPMTRDQFVDLISRDWVEGRFS